MVDPPNPFGLFFTSPAKQLLGKMGQEDFFCQNRITFGLVENWERNYGDYVMVSGQMRLEH